MMKVASADLTERVLSKSGIVAAVAPDRAIDAFSTALAAILRFSGQSNLDALDRLQGFPAINLGSLTAKERGFLQAEIDSRIDRASESTIAQLQERVQGVIEARRRKRLAAYYTKPTAVAVMAEMAQLYREAHVRRKLIVADPFLGSGLTLTGAIKRIGEDSVAMAWGIEPYPLSAVIAYAALLYQLSGDRRRVRVEIGDAFASLGLGSDATVNAERTLIGADVVLTNPPFTRWELLDSDYRAYLREVVVGSPYNRFLARRQLNLQLVAMFLIDRVLKESGLLVSVLPASTFYTIAGEAVKRLLRGEYVIHALIESLPDASFSTKSGFKELILAATKVKPHRTPETTFISLGSSFDPSLAARVALAERAAAVASGVACINRVKVYDLPGIWDMNWLVFFGETRLRRIVTEVLTVAEKGRLVDSWANLFGSRGMIRGVEMYGPSFFLLPNDHWSLGDEENDSLLVKELHGDRSLRIPKEFLVATLRKPGLYTDTIRVHACHYFLALPPVELDDLPNDVAEYIDWGLNSNAARPAAKAFGNYWYAHVHRQLQAKRPHGRLFLPDKVDPRFEHRGAFANYTEEPVTASKNFYIVRSDNREDCRILAAWFNSSLFLALLLLVGRRLSETWTRLLKDDYLKLPVINARNLGRSSRSRVLSAFERLLTMRALPPLKQQLTSDYRFALDSAFAEAMGLQQPESAVRRLHAALRARLGNRVT